MAKKPNRERDKRFGARVRKYRYLSGLTIEALAFNARTSVTTINNVQAGRQAPDVHLAHQIATTLGISIADLLDKEEI